MNKNEPGVKQLVEYVLVKISWLNVSIKGLETKTFAIITHNTTHEKIKFYRGETDRFKTISKFSMDKNNATNQYSKIR